MYGDDFQAAASASPDGGNGGDEHRDVGSSASDKDLDDAPILPAGAVTSTPPFIDSGTAAGSSPDDDLLPCA